MRMRCAAYNSFAGVCCRARTACEHLVVAFLVCRAPKHRVCNCLSRQTVTPAQLALVALFVETPKEVGADRAESKLAKEAGDELMAAYFVHLKRFVHPSLRTNTTF